MLSRLAGHPSWVMIHCFGLGTRRVSLRSFLTSLCLGVWQDATVKYAPGNRSLLFSLGDTCSVFALPWTPRQLKTSVKIQIGISPWRTRTFEETAGTRYLCHSVVPNVKRQPPLAQEVYYAKHPPPPNNTSIHSPCVLIAPPNARP